MSWQGWALPTFAAAIVGLVLFSANSYFDYPYFDTDTRSVSRPVMPVFSPDDRGLLPAQQRSEASTPTSLPTHAEHPASEGTITSADPWASEAMETASREPVAVESDELDGAVEGDGLLRGGFDERANLSEGSVSSEGESAFLEPSPTQSTTAYSQDPAQTSVDPNTGATVQEASTLTPPSDPSTSMGTPSPPSPPLSPDASLPRERDASTGRANAKPKRVLLVDDPRALGENLVTELKREPDLEVVGQTGSLAECGNFVSAEGGLDAAIVGLFLLDGQGLSLIEGVRRFCPHVPLLVLTPSLDLPDQERVVKAGADAVLAKDAASEEVASTIRRLSPG
jgi:CheY-like chemotaxis protein